MAATQVKESGSTGRHVLVSSTAANMIASLYPSNKNKAKAACTAEALRQVEDLQRHFEKLGRVEAVIALGKAPADPERSIERNPGQGRPPLACLRRRAPASFRRRRNHPCPTCWNPSTTASPP